MDAVSNIHSRAYAESYLSSHLHGADGTYRKEYWNHFLLNAVIAPTEGSHLLEEGGGTCGVWKHLNFSSYTSVDVSEEMILAARELHRGDSQKNFYQGSIKTVQLAAEQYDAIVANAFGVYYRPELDALKKLSACLKPDGLLFVAIDPANTLKHRFLWPLAGLINKYRPYNRISESVFLKMTKQAGLRVWMSADYTPAPGWVRKAYFLTKP